MKKRLLSFVLTICMVVGMMPAVGITASAGGGPEEYYIWVGGVQVTSDNKDNITGAGITGDVSYNSENKTLALSGASITGTFLVNLATQNAYAGIRTEQELTIELHGDCSIIPPSPTGINGSCGIYSGGQIKYPLTLSGTGTLLAQGADVTASNLSSYGIYSTGLVTISGPDVTAAGGSSSTGGSYGTYVGGKLIVSGGEVTATGGNSAFASYGISALSFEISGETAVTATGGTAGPGFSSYGISAFNGDSYISGGTVTATGGTAGTKSYGIYTNNMRLYITGGTVTAKTNMESSGTRAAMNKAPDISGYSGAVTLTGGSESLAQVVAAYTNEKYAKFGTMNTYKITYDNNGGSGSMTGGTAAAGVAFPLPESTFNPPAGKAFSKWAVDRTEGTPVLANGSHTFTDHTTVYAIWEAITPTISINDVSVAEGNSRNTTMTFTVSLGVASGNTVTVNYATGNGTATGGNDYDLVSGSLTFGPGETTKTISVMVFGDTFHEDDETFYLTLSGAANATISDNQGVGTIVNDDLAAPSGGGGSSAPLLITKIDTGGTVTGANVDRLVKEGKTLTVEGKSGEKLVFDTEALKNIGDQTNDSLKVEIKDVSTDHNNKLPGKLVISLTLTAGGKKISNFGSGTATISLPYELQEGEKTEDVTVWYLAEDGTMSEVPCSYDPKTKMATFKVHHFSLYVVGTDALARWVNPFSDIKENHWFYEAVRFVSANNLMQGTTDTAFAPKEKTTRGMIVTTLWRMENQPKAIKESTFADVKSDKYYHDAVAWASEKGIVSGYSAEKFGPEDSITREQLAVILHNYAAGKGYKIGTAGDLSVFSDAGSIHKWGKEAMAWASGEGLINGTGNSLLDPSGTAERSQVAAILQRFVEKIAN